VFASRERKSLIAGNQDLAFLITMARLMHSEHFMNGTGLWNGAAVEEQIVRTSDVSARVLRSRLVNLTLDWELAALTLDAQRYRANGNIERESLREKAIAYRKCIAELTEVLSASSLLACKA